MGPEPRGADGAADRHPLVHQRGERDPPAIAGRAERLGVRDARVGEVHLVELGLAGHLPQRADLDAGGVHVDDEGGEAGVLHGLRVGAHDEQAPPRDVGQRRPDLLAVDDPLVAVPDAARRQSGEVGPAAGLGEQLAPDLFAGEQGAEVAALLLLGPPLHDRRRAHAVADRVPVVRVGSAGCQHPLVDEALQAGRQAEAAVALREVHPGQAEVELGAEELRGARCWPAGAPAAARRSGRRRAARRSGSRSRSWAAGY